ncbi:hypothetical protein SAMN05444420_103257 [Capnocytophaga granulosa]|jgi:hypothetical protein|uniref:Uncharacterized protein n=1 Tax=Capnocytophaga granulosa TaxID=45242 RepID=A0A1H2VQL4_9FLAO|nr:hypothetical protein [Capnocytophaga granulosa]EPD28482.1 hypothetical protein HMPREF9331_01682 [Capnocytophaga granulosa ATCC 51502]SDW70613.1 hypothetical protein SAMN05444420_103257 [Capnocytophaga granulosa]SUX17256.1 Uncharacterised protein [Capnocytophaga granulosa]
MKLNFEKTVGKIQDFFAEENLEKLTMMMEKFQSRILEAIEDLSQRVKDATDLPCEMISTEKLDMENLKEIIRETKVEDAKFLAVLNGGRNKKDKLELYLQYMDQDKQALDMNKIICVRCDIMAETLREAFGDKELLIVKL